MANGIVTLCDNDSYAKGALVLARSLRNVGTAADLICLISNSIGVETKSKLETVFNKLITVSIIDSKDQANLALLKRPELGVTLTKLHVWKLTDYSKLVFMDSDMLAVRPIEDLFEREELSAAPDCGWPSCFNTGLFVLRPSLETYAKLVDFAETYGSFDGGDQGLLNSYFSEWSTGHSSRRLPFGYNVTSGATYTYAPAFKHYGNEVRVIHFLGKHKPWTSQQPPAAGSFNFYWSVWWKYYTNDYTEYENFAPSQTTTGTCSQEVAQAAKPIWIDADTDEAAERRWLENVPDYKGKDSYDKVEERIQTELNKPIY